MNKDKKHGPNIPPGKKKLHSKTLWANGIILLTGVTLLAENLIMHKDLLPPEWVWAIVITGAVANVILRIKTSKPII